MLHHSCKLKLNKKIKKSNHNFWKLTKNIKRVEAQAKELSAKYYDTFKEYGKTPSIYCQKRKRTF